jgi:hypothetical protein
VLKLEDSSEAVVNTWSQTRQATMSLSVFWLTASTPGIATNFRLRLSSGSSGYLIVEAGRPAMDGAALLDYTFWPRWLGC